MTAMNRALIKHLKAQEFSFDVHEISGKKVKNSKIESKVIKRHHVPGNLVFKFSEPAEGQEFIPPHEIIMSSNTICFSWATSHHVLANILIPIGTEDDDKWTLKKKGLAFRDSEFESIKAEIRSAGMEFLESTGFRVPFEPSIRMNSNGAYGDFKIVAAGALRCIQVIFKGSLLEPSQFLSKQELIRFVKVYGDPMCIQEFAHVKTPAEFKAELMKVYDEAIESGF